MIRVARVDDLPVCQDIEIAAGKAFAAIGMPEIAGDEPFSLAVLGDYQRAGRAWVAGDPAYAYLLAKPVDSCLHVEQVSVRPEMARRGIGRALIDHAGAGGPLTLTTFTEVPWNAPYYERLGFRRLAEDELTPGLRAIRAEEAAHGLDRWPRIAMRRD